MLGRWLCFALCGAAGAQEAGSDVTFEQIRRAHATHADAFFEKELGSKGVIPLHSGVARLWLNRDLTRGNEELREAYRGVIAEVGGPAATAMTPEIAGAERVKWQMRTWQRVYWLFADRSRFYPGRMERQTQAVFEELFWNYAVQMSNYPRADVRHVWGIHGSENHEMMHYSNALLALQAVKDQLAYRDRALPDGRTAAQHWAAWNAYYKHYCDERAEHGLLVEVFSGYGKYTMPELFNLCDLAEDPVLRRKMEMLLHLIWTDWAVGQINGVRGGGRTRIYQGAASGPDVPEAELTRGTADTWLHMSWFLLGSGRWWEHRWHPDPIRGMSRVLATTPYRLPDVIMDLARDASGRGEYVYVARRIAKQHVMPADDVPVTFSPWYAFDSNDPRMLGYDYCTPDYVMGSLLIDPTLPLVSSHTYLQGEDLQEGYPPLSSQNRYHCIVFATSPDARVVPQCLPQREDYRKTYGQQQAIQHENVMIAQQHAKGRNVAGMRVFFGQGMKERLVEEAGGWLMLEEGNAYLAVKGFSREDGEACCGYAWHGDSWLHLDDGGAPVVFVAGRRETAGTFAAFRAYVAGHSSELAGSAFTYACRDVDGDQVTLRLYLDCSAVPEVNGAPVDFTPRKVFDCPFFTSDHGSGRATVSKGDRRLDLDFTK